MRIKILKCKYTNSSLPINLPVLCPSTNEASILTGFIAVDKTQMTVTRRRYRVLYEFLRTMTKEITISKH